METRFEIGDLVDYDGPNEYGMEAGKRYKVFGMDTYGYYHVGYPQDQHPTWGARAEYLKPINLPKGINPVGEIKCECGSDSVVSYSGHHSRWCPKFRG